MSGDERAFGGMVLICIGVLIASLSGLCTSVYGVGVMTTPPSVPGGGLNLAGPGMLIFAIPVGGVPFEIGLLLVYWGRRLAVSDPRPAIQRGFGTILVIVGVLIATLSGLYAANFFVTSLETLTEMRSSIQIVRPLFVVGVFLGLPFALGVWLAFLGRGLLGRR